MPPTSRPEATDLPSYDAVASNLNPPPYPRLLPEKFRVGDRQVAPFVGVDELEAHLRILGAFHRLKTLVEQESQQSHASLRLDPSAAWTVFLCRAVHRFTRWLEALQALPQERALPPLDVLMVWHAYMLNPLTYKEDGDRLLKQLKELDRFPVRGVAKAIDPTTFEYSVSDGTRDLFESTTKESFIPPVLTQPEDRINLTCPCCDSKKEYAWPWVDDKGTGWAQREFRARCPDCHEKFNHEAYGVRRFCNEMIMLREAQAYSHTKDTFFLAGTMHPKFIHKAPQVLGLLAKHVAASATGASFAKAMNWQMHMVEKWCMELYNPSLQAVPGVLPPRIAAILRHYAFPGPFSIELTGAVMRQSSFIRRMVALGWTQNDRFREDPSPLVRAIARYHAFLDLMWTNYGSFLVPTLDIDLAWHTHQLNAAGYHKWTMKCLGRIPDHDDKVEENTLSNAFDLTSRIWRERYGVPYSLCGCASQTESRTARALRRVASALPGTRSKSAPPAPTNKRPDLISTVEDPDEGIPTHPSEHNSIVVNQTRWTVKRKRREQRHAELLEKRAKAVEQGHADAWSVLQEQRARKRRHSIAARDQRDRAAADAHDAAFF